MGLSCRFTRDWFTEVIPITKLDFTTVLPRFISLYIFSFLNPKELCIAAQVSWHWKFLAEQVSCSVHGKTYHHQLLSQNYFKVVFLHMIYIAVFLR